MKRKILSPECWPDPDRTAWYRSVKWNGFLESQKESRWAPATLKSNGTSYGSWLGFLHDFDPTSLTEMPCARVTEARLRPYIESISGSLSPGTVGRYVYNIYRVLKVIEPTENLKWLYYLSWNMMKDAETEWRWDIVSSTKLSLIGEKKMNRVWFAASRGKDIDRTMRHRYRDGLMITLMAHTAMRVGEFSQLSYENCVEIGEKWVITVPAHLTKSKRQDHEYPLGEELARYFGYYLRNVRPFFSGASETMRLWIDDNRILTVDRIRKRIMDGTEYSLGEPVRPHDFRRSAATTIMLHSPHDIKAAQDLLAHSNDRMTKRYIQASQSLIAGGLLADAIESMRLPRPLKRRGAS